MSKIKQKDNQIKMLDQNEFLHPDKECLTREQIDALQVERLQATIRHCMHSPFYKKKFEEMGINPEDIKTPADVRKLPFTTKQD